MNNGPEIENALSQCRFKSNKNFGELYYQMHVSNALIS